MFKSFMAALPLAALGGVCFISAATAQAYTYATITVKNSRNTQATSINDHGTVVGYRFDSAGNYHAYVYKSGNLTPFAYPGSTHNTSANSININGKVVGSYQDNNGVVHGFEYGVGPSGYKKFWTVDAPGSTGTTLLDAGNGGPVFGTSFDANGQPTVFYHKNSVFTTVATGNIAALLGSSANGYLAGAYLTAPGGA
jgi:probable HAF family extracellular repeat protein